MAQILVVDDEIGIRELLSEILRDEGYDVALAADGETARMMRRGARPDLVLLDIWMPDIDGITLLKEWAETGQLTMPVIMMSGHGSIDTAVEATRIGAYDFLEKPIALQKLLQTVKRGLQKTSPRASAEEVSLAAFPRSTVLRDLKKKLEQVAEKAPCILLKSQLSTIAELCARTLHRPGSAWIDLSLSSTPLNVATLETAREGLLFVPELQKLSRLQQKNLHFALGKLNVFNFHLVTATVYSAEELQQMGWPEALLQRLFEVVLPVPSLNHIREEVPEIAAQILLRLVESGEVPSRRIATAALNCLRNSSWKGGYGELRSVVRSLALGVLEEEIGEQDVRHLLTSMAPDPAYAFPLDMPMKLARETFERLYFEYHLRDEAGNMTRLAEKTGIERTHLYRKLKALGLSPERKSVEQ